MHNKSGYLFDNFNAFSASAQESNHFPGYFVLKHICKFIIVDKKKPTFYIFFQ